MRYNQIALTGLFIGASMVGVYTISSWSQAPPAPSIEDTFFMFLPKNTTEGGIALAQLSVFALVLKIGNNLVNRIPVMGGPNAQIAATLKTMTEVNQVMLEYLQDLHDWTKPIAGVGLEADRAAIQDIHRNLRPITDILADIAKAQADLFHEIRRINK